MAASSPPPSEAKCTTGPSPSKHTRRALAPPPAKRLKITRGDSAISDCSSSSSSSGEDSTGDDDDMCAAQSEAEKLLESRKQRNREAAALSRKRTRVRMQMLETLEQQLQRRKMELEGTVLYLQTVVAAITAAPVVVAPPPAPVLSLPPMPDPVFFPVAFDQGGQQQQSLAWEAPIADGDELSWLTSEGLDSVFDDELLSFAE